jgi:hypothetical protein
VVGALLAVLAVALVIGGVVGAVAYGAVRAAGIGDNPSPASAEPAASSPSAGASSSARPHAASAKSSKRPARHHTAGKPAHRPRHHHRAHRHHRARAGAPTLGASPGRVSPMGRIDLSGRYPGHAGAWLQVQQRVGGGPWRDFPVTVTVRGGGFRTWVASGRRGVNQFRVLDRASGGASAPVTVVVG